MKATELRIGNLLKDRFNRDVCVMEILSEYSRLWLNDDWISEGYDFLQPIPLTEELLLRFGFAKIEREDEDFIYFKKDNIELCDVSPNGFELVWYELAPCIYVHHLQNITFALTGEELTLSKTNDPL